MLEAIRDKVNGFLRATRSLRGDLDVCPGCGRLFDKEKYGHECEYPGCTEIVCPRCRFCNKHAQCPDCGRLFLVETGHACAHPECDKLLCPYCPPYCKEHRSEMEEEAVAEGAASEQLSA